MTERDTHRTGEVYDFNSLYTQMVKDSDEERLRIKVRHEQTVIAVAISAFCVGVIVGILAFGSKMIP